jgi:hypothetical protein
LHKIKDVQASNTKASTNYTRKLQNNNSNNKLLEVNTNNAPIAPTNAPLTPIHINEIIDHNSDDIKCNNCNQIFTRHSSYKRHVLFRCKMFDEPLKDTNKDVLNLLTHIEVRQIQIQDQQIQIQEHKQEIETLQNTITDLQSKIRSESTTTNNITNNNNNNTINITNNNNNIVYKFGTKIEHSLITTEKMVHFLNHITS